MIVIPLQLQSISMLIMSIFFILNTRGFAQATNLGKCTKGSVLDETNRDNKKPEFPLQEDLRIKSSFIYKAHEVLRNGLEELLEPKQMDLGFYLNVMAQSNATYYDENGKIISSYIDVWSSIWKQYNETLCENYATKQFENDKLDLCSVARYLSHQQLANIILKRIGAALKIKKCDTCLPYNRKQPGETIPCPSSLLANPAFDYDPCNISHGNVVCDRIPLKEIQSIFHRTSFPKLNSVKLILQPFIVSETFIPEDVFRSKRIIEITIEYPYGLALDRFYSLQVDLNAFRSTKSYTKKFEINIVDCTLLDLDFLSGFDKLMHLAFTNIYNIQHCLPSLPSLPSLSRLDINFCTGMNEINIFPSLTNGLKKFDFYGDEGNIEKTYNDKTVDRIINWLLLSSTNTLDEMAIVKMNQVTRVPNKIASFKALRKLWLYNNKISFIKTGAFSFSVPVSDFNICDNQIKEIEPGAFQGDFKDAQFWMYNNNLTRFEESVFGPILKQMNFGTGFINTGNVAGNPIDCTEGSICHLAWLRSYKAGPSFQLSCSNGTPFKDLEPAVFNYCP